jgi:DNA adenine methylase
MNPVERAWKFYYCLKLSFSGMRRTFGTSTTDCMMNLKGFREIVERSHERLIRVTIENLDFRKFFKKYNRKYSFKYIDPPYPGKTSKNYKGLMMDRDFYDLRHCLKVEEGKFLMSLSDSEFIREVFKDFRIETIRTRYSLGKKNNVQELVIMNY